MARPNSSERARRLIALLGQLAPGTRIPLHQLAERLGVSDKQVASDLSTLSMCGVAPYDPLDMVPVMVDGDEVEVFGEIPALRGPVRLSIAEANALAAALNAAGFSSDDELVQRLLSASTAAFDEQDLEDTLRAGVSPHSRDIYTTLSQAMANHEVVRVEHLTTGTDTPKTREIEPTTLFAEKSAWYLQAWCRLSGGWRTFRLDHMLSAETTGEHFEPRPTPASQMRALDPYGLPKATLRFEATEPFNDREWPGSEIVSTEPDGATIAAVPYAGGEWIARQVCARLGEVSVLAPEELRQKVRDTAAKMRQAL